MKRRTITVKQALAYARYVVSHKRSVFAACRRLRVPLWRAVIHDWSKFTPSEFFAYADTFFDDNGNARERPDLSTSWFQLAVKFHYQRNDHHWQHYRHNDELTPMPEPAIREMIADWHGFQASRSADGSADPRAWYVMQSPYYVFHAETRAAVEAILIETYGAL